MRFLVWTCRVIVAAVIGCSVAVMFYLTHTVAIAESAKAALNWITVVGAALVGLTWPLMRRYWQALILLVGLGVFRALFGIHPALSSLHTPLLTRFQSDFLWIPIGVVFLALVGSIVFRAIASDRKMQAMRQAASTVTTGQDVAFETTAVLQEVPPASTEPLPVAPAIESEVEAETPETGAPAEEVPAVSEQSDTTEDSPPKKE